MSDKITNSWPERNKGPILEVLRRVLPDRGTVLEIGSGSGQHAVYFAEHLPTIDWLPTDMNSDNLASIRAWRDDAGRPNLCEPRRLDVLDDEWGVGPVDAVFSANMIHIAPWECCLGLMAGAYRHLVERGLLILYGPFRIGGEHTADSNAVFDEDLKARDSRWGVRDLEAVAEAAQGFELEKRVEMPANNQTIIFRRADLPSIRS